MCGIVGVIGQGPAAPRILTALRRLEYRGYDSAGVATLEDGVLTRVRAEGKLKNLEQKLERAPLSGPIGIGHTRWATHGKPTETNAHPHASDRLAVVHNGIIENFKVLREELTAKGHVFRTETDSEVAAFLLARGAYAYLGYGVWGMSWPAGSSWDNRNTTVRRWLFLTGVVQRNEEDECPCVL